MLAFSFLPICNASIAGKRMESYYQYQQGMGDKASKSTKCNNLIQAKAKQAPAPAMVTDAGACFAFWLLKLLALEFETPRHIEMAFCIHLSPGAGF